MFTQLIEEVKMKLNIISLIFSFVFILNSSVKAIDTESSNQDSTVYIAIMMGGGVSLGSYEAGVLAELITQLEYQNRLDNGTKYKIDVMVGASAGSVTLGLVADQMYNNMGLDPESTNLYKVWTEEMDIRNLLPGKRDKSENNNFFFDSSLLDRLAEDYLVSNNTKERLSIAPDTLWMAMTISNMDGLKYPINFRNENPGIKKIVEFKDDVRYFSIFNTGQGSEQQLKFNASNPDLDFKGEICKDQFSLTAIASGSFPYAFKPRNVIRYAGEFKKGNNDVSIPEQLKNTKAESFEYADGGLYNNNPIYITKRIASIVDGRRTKKERFRRVYLYLDPESQLSEKDMIGSYQTNLKQYLKKILKMSMDVSSLVDNHYFIDSQTEDNQYINDLFIVSNNSPDTSKKINLSGAKFEHFAGFFNEDARKLDFYAGRYSTQKLLKDQLSLDIYQKIGESNKEQNQKEIEQYQNIKDFIRDKKDRRVLRDRIAKRFDNLFSDLDIPYFARPALRGFISVYLNKKFYYRHPGIKIGFSAPKEFFADINTNYFWRDHFDIPSGGKKSLLQWLAWYAGNEVYLHGALGLKHGREINYYNFDRSYYDVGGKLIIFYPGDRPNKIIDLLELIKLEFEYGVRSYDHFGKYYYRAFNFSVLNFSLQTLDVIDYDLQIPGEKDIQLRLSLSMHPRSVYYYSKELWRVFKK